MPLNLLLLLGALLRISLWALEAPGLGHSVTDGCGATEPTVLVGVVDDQDRGGWEQITVVLGQPLQRSGEV